LKEVKSVLTNMNQFIVSALPVIQQVPVVVSNLNSAIVGTIGTISNVNLLVESGKKTIETYKIPPGFWVALIALVNALAAVAYKYVRASKNAKQTEKMLEVVSRSIEKLSLSEEMKKKLKNAQREIDPDAQLEIDAMLDRKRSPREKNKNSKSWLILLPFLLVLGCTNVSVGARITTTNNLWDQEELLNGASVVSILEASDISRDDWITDRRRWLSHRWVVVRLTRYW
jgi:hypothetical protein